MSFGGRPSHRRIINLSLVTQKNIDALMASQKMVSLIDKAKELNLTVDTASVQHDTMLREGDFDE